MVEIFEENHQLIVRLAGQEYTRYHFEPTCWKPYLFPLRAANGLSLLANAPTDHRHHHGIWFGHGRVDENDFWLERHNSGKIVHRGFSEIAAGGEVGGFTAANDWVAANGVTLLTDTRTFTFYDQPADARMFDIAITLRSPDGRDVTLYPTNEAGLPHIRAAEGLTGKTGGTLTNAEGKTNERGTYKQRSPWVDSSGMLGRQVCGIAIFDHPDNPAHPTPWFTRDYGPFSPNYGFFQPDPIVIASAQPLLLRYRVYTHSGDAETGKVHEAWETFRASVSTKDLVGV